MILPAPKLIRRGHLASFNAVGSDSSSKPKGLLYGKLSGFYDLAWSRIMQQGWDHSMARIDIPEGARVLEIGVGTGLSLPLYPSHCHVTALDLSAQMLRRAKARVARKGLQNVSLIQADAQKLEQVFRERSFDLVVAAYTLSVVPEPDAVLRGMCHVARDDARVVVINHLHSNIRWQQRIERLIHPLCRRLGWDSVADLRPTIDAAGLEVGESSRFGMFQIFSCLQARKAAHLHQPAARNGAARNGDVARDDAGSPLVLAESGPISL
jgi:phosphatidylethanolamine/phosphatidyl-N-methylethanolamine N-methyltransferase